MWRSRDDLPLTRAIFDLLPCTVVHTDCAFCCPNVDSLLAAGIPSYDLEEKKVERRVHCNCMLLWFLISLKHFILDTCSVCILCLSSLLMLDCVGDIVFYSSFQPVCMLSTKSYCKKNFNYTHNNYLVDFGVQAKCLVSVVAASSIDCSVPLSGAVVC